MILVGAVKARLGGREWVVKTLTLAVWSWDY